MQAILLAGGLGTRLRSVVNDRPKPMALIQDKPFMEYLINELKKNGITDIIFAVGYKGSLVEEYFGNGEGFGINVIYSYEDQQLGTAGAIKNAEKYISDDKFFVLNADTFYTLPYSRLLELQKSEDSEMVLVLRKVPDCTRYGIVTLEESRVTGFNEKSTEHTEGLINGGVYLMNKTLLDDIPEGKVSLENEMIPMWLERNYTLSAFVNEGYFIDIGIPEDYFRFQKDVESGVIWRLV